MPDTIAVIGGSNGGYAAAADLTSRGFTIQLYVRTPDHHRALLDTEGLDLVVSPHYRGPYREPGERREVSLSRVTSKLSEAVSGADLVLVPLPTTAQEHLYPNLAPILESGQIVVLCPGNAGSILLSRAVDALSSPPEDLVIAETPTLPYVTRKSGSREVTINLDAVDLPVGAFPGSGGSRALEVFAELYDSARGAQNALDCALNNSNVCVNATPTILNAGVIDNEEFPKFNIHRHGVTDRVYEVIMAVDRERVGLREELGFDPPHFTQDEYYRPDQTTSGEHFYGRESRAALHSAETFSKDPPSLDSRYIHEDVSVNAVLLSSLGDTLGRPTSTLNALIRCADALMGEDFRATGRTLEHLGLADRTRNDFERCLREGWT